MNIMMMSIIIISLSVIVSVFLLTVDIEYKASAADALSLATTWILALLVPYFFTKRLDDRRMLKGMLLEECNQVLQKAAEIQSHIQEGGNQEEKRRAIMLGIKALRTQTELLLNDSCAMSPQDQALIKGEIKECLDKYWRQLTEELPSQSFKFTGRYAYAATQSYTLFANKIRALRFSIANC